MVMRKSGCRSAIRPNAPSESVASAAIGNMIGQLAGQHGDPFHLLRHSAELRVKYAVGQMLHTARQFGFTVLVPEELRVRQARPQHAFVARDDSGPAILRLDIGDHDETWCERPVGVEQREILLMRPHRRD